MEESYNFKQKCIVSFKTLKTFLENISETEQTLYVFNKEGITRQYIEYSNEELLKEHLLNDDKIEEIINESSKLLDTEETVDNDKMQFNEK